MIRPRPEDTRPRCPWCRHVLRHPGFSAPFAPVPITVCQLCGRVLPSPTLVQYLYEEDELRRLAELLVAGGGDREDAVTLARAWLALCE